MNSENRHYCKVELHDEVVVIKDPFGIVLQERPISSYVKELKAILERPGDHIANCIFTKHGILIDYFSGQNEIDRERNEKATIIKKELQKELISCQLNEQELEKVMTCISAEIMKLDLHYGTHKQTERQQILYSARDKLLIQQKLRRKRQWLTKQTK